MSEEREKGPSSTGFSIEGYRGIFGINPDNTGISIEDPNREDKSIDFSFAKEGVCRYPKTMEALNEFRSPDPFRLHWTPLPILVSAQDNSRGKKLIISVDPDRDIHVIIDDGSRLPFSFVLLGRNDEDFCRRILSPFINLALAIQEDEARVQGRSS